MNANQYKRLKGSGAVLDFSTLNETYRILMKRNQIQLAELVASILTNGRVDKPSLHNSQQHRFSDYYQVNLAAEEVASIVSTLFDYETDVVDLNPSAADLTDRWNDLYEQTKR